MRCRRHIWVLQLGLVMLLLANVLTSQTLFKVSNPKQQEWP